MQIQKLRALLRVDHRGCDQRGHQRRGSAQAVEVFKQVLHRGDRKITHHRAQNFNRAGEISGQRIGHAGAAREFGGAVGEHLRRGVGAGERGEDNGQRLGLQGSRGNLANGFIRIRGQDGEKLDAFGGFQGSGAAANCQLVFAGRLARVKFFPQTGANLRLLAAPFRASRVSVTFPDLPDAPMGAIGLPFSSSTSAPASRAETSKRSLAENTRFSPAFKVPLNN